MTDRRPVLRFARTELVLGPKVWWGCLVAVALIGLGISVTPSNGWAGAGIGVAGILGATLSALFQTTPRERDLSPNGASAVRGLLHIAQDVDNTQVLITQLAQANTRNTRLTLGLVDAQDRLKSINSSIYSAMAEWDAVAPGALKEVNRLRDEGQRAFEMLAKESQNE
ncbi:hypothetical protein [Clavibacter sp. Sh2088]|uniref:hypothetical protein n=1 Tax=Clavibacter sp. Sh2088 TaxID=3397676 RepID=UPI0039E09B71